MLKEEKKKELKEKVRYNPKATPNKILKTIRGMPNLYSKMCKTRRYLSKTIANKEGKELLENNISLFKLNEFETKHLNDLNENGYTVINDLFSDELIDTIDEKADKLFKDLKIKDSGYNVSHGRIPTLRGFTYEELEAFEQNITLEDPFLNIPEDVEIFFNESILKIVTNYLGYIPSHGADIFRNFPQEEPIESSNFHKDSDDHDVVQVFVYLIDIDGKRGPLTYVPNSHRHDAKSCVPRTNYDLDSTEIYGRVSDEEVEKVYPRKDWVTFYGKKATVAIADVNGFHKGPNWDEFGNSENKHRDTIRFTLRGRSFEKSNASPANIEKIYKADVDNMSDMQKLFLNSYEIIG